MSTLPSANVTVDPTASAPAGGSNLVCVMAPVATHADMIPRLYGSVAALVAYHGYSEGAEYASMHIDGTGKPVLFCGMPINTAGSVSRSTTFENTGTSVPTVTAGGAGFLAEHDGVLKVVKGGTIGTSQIKLQLSLDGGKSFRSIRLGTSSSFTLPDVNGSISFGAGTLVDGDTILRWHGSGPLPSTSDLATVRSELGSRQFRFRDALLCGDLPDATAANAVVAQANAYATSNRRHIDIACSVFDRLPQASMSRVTWRMTGSPALTFAEVGASADTCTRATGSWLADGAADGDTVTITGAVAGSGHNNVTGQVTTFTATVMTMGTTDFDAEVLSTGGVVTGSPTLTFAATSVTRSRGSWLADGFRIGGLFSVLGTASNNYVAKPITNVTASTITFASGGVSESIRSDLVTVTQGETKAAWMQRADDAFASIDAQARIHLGAGRATFPSPYSGWHRRVSAQWLASVRAYQHDLHRAEWRKDDGSIGGASLEDANGDSVEWNDDTGVDGGAGSAARFTTLRTWPNGPDGVFVSLSLTRAGDGQLQSLRPIQSVVNAVCNTVQAATENAIGRDLILNADGTATADFLKVLAAEVNAALETEILRSRGEGPRASSVTWTPSPTDVYNVPEPVTNGTVLLVGKGYTHTFNTRVQIVANGQ